MLITLALKGQVPMPLIYAFNRACRSPQTSTASNINGIDPNIKQINHVVKKWDDIDPNKAKTF